MSKIKKYPDFTLIEVLFAIALLGIFFNLALMFYYNGRKVSMKYMDKAVQVRSVSTIAECWRNFIHTAPVPLRVEADKILFKNNAAVLIKNNQLCFIMPEGQKTFVVPKGFTASFSQETNLNEPDILILNFKTLGSKDQVLKDKFIRVAAHMKRGGK